MRKSALMILTHPHFIGALSLLLFAILLAAGGIGFASATQAAGLAVAFLVAATPSRENPPQTGAWWQAGCAAAFLLVAGCALVMDPIARLYATGFVFLALLGIRWLLFGRFSDRRDLFLPPRSAARRVSSGRYRYRRGAGPARPRSGWAAGRGPGLWPPVRRPAPTRRYLRPGPSTAVGCTWV